MVTILSQQTLEYLLHKEEHKMAINYTIKYLKDDVEKTYTHSFETEPTFSDIEALKNNFDYDSIVDYIREDA